MQLARNFDSIAEYFSQQSSGSSASGAAFTSPMGKPRQSAALLSGGMVFVTVGTTKFDALIAAIDDVRVADALVARGYDHLVMQASPIPSP